MNKKEDPFNNWLKEAIFKHPELASVDEKVLRIAWNGCVDWMVLKILVPHSKNHTTETGD